MRRTMSQAPARSNWSACRPPSGRYSATPPSRRRNGRRCSACRSGPARRMSGPCHRSWGTIRSPRTSSASAHATGSTGPGVSRHLQCRPCPATCGRPRPGWGVADGRRGRRRARSNTCRRSRRSYRYTRRQLRCPRICCAYTSSSPVRWDARVARATFDCSMRMVRRSMMCFCRWMSHCGTRIVRDTPCCSTLAASSRESVQTGRWDGRSPRAAPIRSRSIGAGSMRRGHRWPNRLPAHSPLRHPASRPSISDVGDWSRRQPALRDPLVVSFPEPLDHALLHRALLVTTDRGLVIGGDVTVEAAETKWVFTPHDAWGSLAYRLAPLSTLEDPAGNRVGRAFEIASSATADCRAGVEGLSFVPKPSRP